MAFFRSFKLPEVFDFDRYPVLVDREVRPVLLAEEVDAANGGFLVHLGQDLAVDSVCIGIDRRHEGEFKLPL